MKLLFFGSSDYCLPILESLNNNFELEGVITRPESSVKQFATFHRVKVFTPKDKTDLLSLKSGLESLEPDLAIVADYGLIIPSEIFTIPRNQTLNIHFSKLPKYRGPSPVQYTILNGEKSAWITIILMDEGMDTGNIVWRKEVGPLDGSETTSLLYSKLFSIAAKELPVVIDKYLLKQPTSPAGRLKLLRQPTTGVSYTKPFTRQDGFIPFSQLVSRRAGSRSAGKLERKIRAFTPWPGVWTKIKIKNQERRLKILKAHLEPHPILKRNSFAKLVLDTVQLEGKKPVSFKQFLEGYPDLAKLYLIGND